MKKTLCEISFRGLAYFRGDLSDLRGDLADLREALPPQAPPWLRALIYIYIHSLYFNNIFLL